MGLSTSTHRQRCFLIVADLIPLFDLRYVDRVVLGGDFNVTTATKVNTPELPRYRAVLNAVESLGLAILAKRHYFEGPYSGVPSKRFRGRSVNPIHSVSAAPRSASRPPAPKSSSRGTCKAGTECQTVVRWPASRHDGER